MAGNRDDRDVGGRIGLELARGFPAVDARERQSIRMQSGWNSRAFSTASMPLRASSTRKPEALDTWRNLPGILIVVDDEHEWLECAACQLYCSFRGPQAHLLHSSRRSVPDLGKHSAISPVRPLMRLRLR